MAIYHLSAQVISRGYGHSAVHAAAYRARCEITDSRTGLVHDYGRKAGELLFEGIYAPKDAPAWARDRAQLWNHVEAFEKHRRAELAREFVIALPHELTLEQGRYAVQDWVRENFTRKGLIADVTIHAPGREGDERNIHAHVMVVTRKLDGSEFIQTKDRFATYSEKAAAKKTELESLRESWARIGNRHLERHGFEASLDHRTLEAQGIEREPSIHMGKAATAIEREGSGSELGDVNREIKAGNDRRVIDLAAERAMREAREAARGQVEDIRPDQSRRDAAYRQHVPGYDAPQQTAREAPQAREAEAAPSAPEAELTPSTPAAPAAELRSAGDITGGLVDGAARLFGRALDFVGGLFEGLFAGPSTPAPEPPQPKPEQNRQEHDAEFQEWVRQHQQQEAQQAAERRAAQEREATAGEAAEQEKLRQALLEQIRRDRRDRLAGYDRDRDDDDRGRERDRGYDFER
jgi:hypothetical protein